MPSSAAPPSTRSPSRRRSRRLAIKLSLTAPSPRSPSRRRSRRFGRAHLPTAPPSPRSPSRRRSRRLAGMPSPARAASFAWKAAAADRSCQQQQGEAQARRNRRSPRRQRRAPIAFGADARERQPSVAPDSEFRRTRRGSSILIENPTGKKYSKRKILASWRRR